MHTFWQPHPAPAHLKARTISSWIPISLLRFVFSQYLTHTHTHTHKHTQHNTHTHPPSSTQFIPIQGYTATTLACASLHPNMHNTSIFKEGIEQIKDGDHTALENAGPFGSRVMWRWLTDSSPTLFLSLSLSHKITNPSLPRTKLSIPQPTRSFPSRPCFSSSLIKHVVSSPSTYTESRCTRISCILHVSIFLTNLTSSSIFVSLSLSLCLVRFVSYSLIHIHTIFPALSAPSSKALSTRFIHTLGYVKMLLL